MTMIHVQNELIHICILYYITVHVHVPLFPGTCTYTCSIPATLSTLMSKLSQMGESINVHVVSCIL